MPRQGRTRFVQIVLSHKTKEADLPTINHSIIFQLLTERNEPLSLTIFRFLRNWSQVGPTCHFNDDDLTFIEIKGHEVRTRPIALGTRSRDAVLRNDEYLPTSCKIGSNNLFSERFHRHPLTLSGGSSGGAVRAQVVLMSSGWMGRRGSVFTELRPPMRERPNRPGWGPEARIVTRRASGMSVK